MADTRTQLFNVQPPITNVFLPDLKYLKNGLARKYSLVEDYAENATAAIQAMAEQVESNSFDSKGMLRKGMIIRHLIIPGEIENSLDVLDWIKENMGSRFPVSLMSQYTPFHKSGRFSNLGRRLRQEEYDVVLAHMYSLKLDGYMQDPDSATQHFTPDFDLSGI